MGNWWALYLFCGLAVTSAVIDSDKMNPPMEVLSPLFVFSVAFWPAVVAYYGMKVVMDKVE